MAEEQQPEQDPGEEFTEEEVGGFQTVLLEVDAASEDLGNFLRWSASLGAEEDDEAAEEFVFVLNQVYSYCRSLNDQPIEEQEDGSSTGAPGDGPEE